MIVPGAVFHAPAVAVQDPLLAPDQVQVEAGPGVVVVDFPQPDTCWRGGARELLYGESLVVPAEVDTAP